MRKTNKEYMSDFEKFIENKSNAGELYKSNAITSQKSLWKEYTEILLNYSEGPKAYFDKIQSNKERVNSYKVKEHSGVTKKGNPSSTKFQTEVRETMAMINCQNTDAPFQLLDYQVPMKNSKKDKEKNIDLVGTDGKSLYILEYKKSESEETLLRSVLECYSYRRFIDEGIDKFTKDFGLPDADVIPAILMMKNSEQYKSFKEAKEKNEKIIELMKKLGVKAFVIEPKGIIFEENLEIKNLLAKEKPEFNFQFEIKEIRI